MSQKGTYKLAIELWLRDNDEVFKYMQWSNPTITELKDSSHWWIAQSRVALRTMRNKRRKAKWEQY